MTVEEIITAHKCCFGTCAGCPLFKVNSDKNCQEILTEATIEKLSSMRDLLDDKVNHHYYDTLEFYQEENVKLRDKLDKIKIVLDE